MAIIVVNGISAKSAGGRSVLTNFLKILKNRHTKHTFIIFIPHDGGYDEFFCGHIKLISFPRLSRQYLIPFVNYFVLPAYLKKLNCDVIFNLADLPIPRSRVPQLFLFDWPYAAYPDSVGWTRGNFFAVAKRRLKIHLFKKYIKFIDLIIAQGPSLRDRLIDLYKFSDVRIVPNAISIDNYVLAESRNFRLCDGFKLLCLSQYYSHKNLEVFLDLAQRIRSAKLNWKIIITIDGDQGPGARKLLYSINKNKLNNIIINVGSVQMSDVPSLYRQCDAVILPSLLESFSGTFVEAMHHGLPIFTSNYDFAIDVCGNAGWYFDPLDVESIFECINSSVKNQDITRQKIECGRNQLVRLLSWDQAFDAYLLLIEELLERNHAR